jgi:hypothetical protein
MRPKRQYSDNCGSLSETAAIEVPRAKAALASAEIPDGHRWDAPPKARFAPDSPLEEERFEPPVPLGRGSAGNVKRGPARRVREGSGMHPVLQGDRWFESLFLQR